MPTDSSTILYDVFISYARKDANLGAAPLDSALKRDFRVWRDTRDLPPEQDFTAEIEKAIKAAARLVVCVTPDVEREDSFVRREIAYANYLKKPILVLRFSETPPPIHVFNHTWIDFFKDWDASFAKLVRWLRGETVDSAAPAGAATHIPAADPYRGYVERLYADVVESLRVSVFSTEAITLRAIESPDDVPHKPKPRINPKFLTTAIRALPEPAPTAPAEFASLHEAYASASCDGRVLLLGEPGAGKTTSLLAFARDAAANRLSDASLPLPVFARISGWDSQAQTPLADWLTAGETDLSATDLRKLIDAGSALLLLDGLDELGNRRPVDPDDPIKGDYDPRERFLKLLPPSGKVILSSRLEEYRQLEKQAGLSCAVRLQRLDDVQMREYLADVPNLWAVVQADDDLKDALRTPLLLALFRVGFEEAPEEARNLRDLSAGDLNEKIWDVFIDRRWAFEQARDFEHPLPYSANELKARLGGAAAIALAERLHTNSTRIFVDDVPGGDGMRIITFALRLDLLFSLRGHMYRFLHLRLRDALASGFLVAILRDRDAYVRGRAADALGVLGDTRVVEPLVAALRDQNEAVRDSVANALAKLGDIRAVEPLVAALRDRNDKIRRHAADILGESGDRRAVEPLIGALFDRNMRARFTDALVKLWETSDFEWLIVNLRHRNDDVRLSAANALAKLGDIRAFEPMICMLQDPVWYFRRSAANALGELGDTRAVEPLIAVLRDRNEAVRDSVANALVKLGDTRTVELLIATLHDQITDRYYAIKVLGKLGDARAVEPLITLLHDPDWSVRAMAVNGLGKLGDRRAVEPLIASLRDPVQYVHYKAIEALENFPNDPSARAALDNYYAGKIKPRKKL